MTEREREALMCLRHRCAMQEDVDILRALVNRRVGEENPMNERTDDVALGQPAPAPLGDEELADYIFRWLERRNGGELARAIGRMRVESYRLAKEELAMILQHRGKPPNWVEW